MKILSMMTLLIWAILSFPANAQVAVQYLGPLDTWPVVSAPLTTDCIIGNTDDPSHNLTSEVMGTIFTGSTFDPNEYGCDCILGFEVVAYHFVVAKVDDVFTEFDVHMTLGDAYLLSWYPPGTTCFLPSPGVNYTFNAYCSTFGNVVALTDPGFYKITLTNITDCGCVLTNYAHFMGFYIPNFPGNTHLVTNSDPDHCPDYIGLPGILGRIAWGGFDAPGNLVLWADINCYPIPIGVETTTWSTLKAIFR